MSCRLYLRGGIRLNISGSVCISQFVVSQSNSSVRLSPLADERRFEALLSHALLLLVAAIGYLGFEVGETEKGLQ